MLTKFFATLLATLSLFAGTVAQAAPAQALSLSNAPAARASTATGASNQAVGNTGFFVVGAIVAGLAIWGLVELVSGDDDNPDSP